MEQTRIELTNEVKNVLMEGAKNLAIESGYDFDDDAFDWNLSQWAKNKAHLFNVLSKDKDFCKEELAIVKNISVNRGCNLSLAEDIISSWVRGFEKDGDTKFVLAYLTEFINDDGKIDLNKNKHVATRTWEKYAYNGDSGLDNLVNWVNGFDTFESDIFKALVLAKSLNIKDGQKASRVLRKVFEKFDLNDNDNTKKVYIYDAKPVRELDENGDWTGSMTKYLNYEQMFAQLSDALSPRQFKYKLVISINPLDYLTQSKGRGWSSCHAFSSRWDDRYSGCNKGATLTMMTDPSSVITYILDENDANTNLWSIEKLQRQTFFVADNHKAIVSNVLYPSKDDNISNVIINEMTTLFNPSMDWCKKIDFSYEMRRNLNQFNTNDYYGYDDWCKSSTYINYVDVDILKDTTIKIGSEAMTIDCYDYFIEDNNSVCSDGDKYWCEYCGEYHYEDDMYYSDYYGRYICENERDNEMYYCEDTDDYRYYDDCWYNDYTFEYYSNNTNYEYVEDYGYVDEYNLETSGDFFQCYECGRWFSYHRENYHEVDWDCYCDSCYDDLELEDEEGDEE